MANDIRLLSGRVKKTPATEADPGRYDFLDLTNAEPDLGVPAANGAPLTSNIDGTRNWSTVMVLTDDAANVSGNITATGNVTANYFVGNISGDSITIVGNLSADYFIGNIDGTTGVFSGNVTAGNVITSGVVSTANVLTNAISAGTLVITATDVNLEISGNLDVNDRWINSVADPVQAQDAATKQYVDDAVSSGIHIHTPVDVETPTALPSATYAQGGNTYTVTDTVAGNTVVFSTAAGLQPNDQLWFSTSFEGIAANTAYFVVSTPNTSAAVLSESYNGEPVTTITSNTGLTESVRVNSGVGATLTATANGALTVDGYSVSAGNRVLVYNQSNQYENGVYSVTVAGDAGNAWVLTRATDSDTYVPDTNDGIDQGSYYFVKFGDTGAGESYVLTQPTGPIIIGFDGIEFTQFSASQVYSANAQAGLVLNNTTFSAKVDGISTAFDAGGNIVVRAGADLVTPNIGNAVGNTLTLTGPGNISANHLDISTVTATGNITANYFLGNIDGGTADFSGNVTAPYFVGNVVGNITGNISAAGANTQILYNADSIVGASTALTFDYGSNVLAVGGNASAGFFLGNIQGTTGVFTGNVQASTVLANISGTTGSFTGNVQASNFLGNLDGTRADLTGNVTAAGFVGTLYGNVQGTTGAFTGNVSANNFLGNVDGTTGTFTGNVTANNFVGNLDGTSADISGNITTANLVVNDVATVSGNLNVNSGNINHYGFAPVRLFNELGTAFQIYVGNPSTSLLEINVQEVNISAAFTEIRSPLYVGSAGFANLYTDQGNATVFATVDTGELFGQANVITIGSAQGNTTVLGNMEIQGSTTVDTVIGNSASFSGNVQANNFLGNVDGTTAIFSGNVTAANFIGNILGNVDAGGANTQVQFNDGDILAGSAAFTFDKTSNLVTVTGNVDGEWFLGNVDGDTGTFQGNVSAANVTASLGVDAATVTASGNVSANNVTITNIVSAQTAQIVDTVEAGNANVTGQLVAGTLETAGNALIGGDLIVQGNLTYINVTDFKVEDPIITMGAGANGSALVADDGKDRGIYMEYYKAATGPGNAFVGWDNNTGNLILAANATISGDVITVVDYGVVQGGDLLFASGNISGNLNVGNVDVQDRITATEIQANIQGTTASFSGNLEAQNITANAAIDTGTVSASGNVSADNIIAINDVSGQTGTFSGNVTAQNFIGNVIGNIQGNIDAGGANTQVQFNDEDVLAGSPAFTFDKASNAVTVTGNVDAEWFLGNVQGTTGNFSGTVTAGNFTGTQSNVELVAGAYTWTFDDSGNTTMANGTVSATTVSVSGNISSGNIDTTGRITATGNIQGGNIVSQASVSTVTVTASGNIAGANLLAVGDVSGSTGTFSGNIAAGNISTTGASQAATISATGNITGNNIVANNDVTTVSVTASGNVSGANITTVGQVEATGNVQGGNINTAGLVLATGNVEGGNINTAGQVEATGNVTGGNLTTAGVVSATGNVTGGNLTTAGDVTGGTATITGNVSGQTFLGNIEGDYASFVGNVTAANFIGNIQGNIDAGGANTQVQFNDEDLLAGSPGFTFDKTSNLVTVSGNVQAENFLGNVDGGAGDFTGNVSAAFFFGNASQLTGLYSNASVADFLADFGSNNIVTTGNVTANYFIGNIDGGEAVFSGNVTAAKFIGNIQGNLTAAGGNRQVQYNDDDVVAASGVFTFDKSSNTVTVLGNVDSGNVNVTGVVSSEDLQVTDGFITTLYTNAITSSTLVMTATDINMVLSGNINMGQRYINNLANPLQAFDAATKQYVDDSVSSGIQIQDPVNVESSTNLAGTYNQGGNVYTVTATEAGNIVVFSTAPGLVQNDQLWFTNSFDGIAANTAYFVVSTPNASSAVLSTAYNGQPVSNITANTGLSESVRVNSGQGANLVNSGSPAVLVIDGVTMTSGDRVLLFNQTNAYENGVYEVTVPGDGGNAWVLTRAPDQNTYIPDSVNGLDAGDYVFVESGLTGGGRSYVLTDPTGSIIIGYDDITWTRFSASGVYQAGNGLSLNGTVFSVNVDDSTTAIVADTVVVKTGANLVTPNIGNATGNSLTLTGNGVLTATGVNVTGNITVGNVNANTGIVAVTGTFTGNVTAGNLNTSNTVSATTVSATTVSATGNVSAGNISVTSNISSATVTATGNVSGSAFLGNVDGTTGSFAGNVTGGNVNTTGAVVVSGTGAATNTTTGSIRTAGGLGVAGNAYVGGLINATGNITGGNLSGTLITGTLTTAAQPNVTSVGTLTSLTVTGNVTGGNLNTANAVVVTGSGAATSTTTGSIRTAGGIGVAGNAYVGGLINATGNITGGNLSGTLVTGTLTTAAQPNVTSVGTLTALTVTGNVNGGNLITSGAVSAASVTASGNVTGDTFLGDVEGTYAVFTGNVTAANFIGNISGNVDAGGANTQVQFNDGDLLAGSPAFTFDKASNLVSISGNVSAANLVASGEVSATNLVVSAEISATGNIAGGNITTTGQIDATGNIAGGNITTVGEVDAQGNISGDNLISSNDVTTVSVTASGNVSGANITTVGQVEATGNVQGGNLVTSGDVTTNTVTASGNVSGSNLVAAGDVTTDTVTASGNITGGNINTGGAIVVSGSDAATSTTTGSIRTAGGLGVAGNAYVGGIIQATGNITGGNLSGTLVSGTLTTASQPNVTSVGTLTALDVTGNVTAAFFLGDGSQLTGIDAAGVQNGTSNIQVLQDSDITFSISGTSNVAVFGQQGANIEGYLTTTGNVTASYFFGNGSQLQGIDATSIQNGTANVRTFLNGNVTTSAAGVANVLTVTSSGLIVSGTADISGNVSAGNISTTDIDASANVNALNVNTDSITASTLTITAAGVNMALTGNVDMNQSLIRDLGTPVSSSDAATKQYVDDAVSAGIHIHDPVDVETPTALPSATYAQGGNTYTVTDTIAGNTVVFSTAAGLQPNDQLWFSNSFEGIVANTSYFVVSTPNTSAAVLSTNYNGEPVTTITSNTGLSQPVRVNSGIGATLTATANGALTIDGYSVSVGNRVLAYNQGTQYENGVYSVTQVGNVSAPWILTRATDSDQFVPDTNDGIDQGSYYYVKFGDTGAGESYVLTQPTGPFIIGFDGIEFTQFSASQVYSANTSAGLSLSGTTFSAKTDGVTTAFDGGGNITVPAGANLTTPNIGDATGTSLSVTGNVAAGNVSGTLITGTLTTAAQPNVTSVGTLTSLTVTGNVTGGNLNTAGAVVVSGSGAATSTTTGSIRTAGGIGIVGNAYVGGLINATGNITGSNLSGTLITGTLTTAAQPNITSVGTLTSLTVTGNVSTGNVSGTLLTGTLATAAQPNVTSLGTLTSLTVTGNVSGGNLNTANAVVVTGSGAATSTTTGSMRTAGGLGVAGNAYVGGLINAVGNITGNYFFGNGSQLTGIDATSIQNGTANVRTFLNGNVTTSAAGTANVLVVTSSGVEIAGTLSASGNANVGNIGATNAVLSGSLSGVTTISASGNANVGNIGATNAAFTSISGTLTTAAQTNITSVGTLTSLTVTGNVSGGNLNTAGAVVVSGSGAATSTTTGSLRTAGGLGVAGNAYVGGLINATGNITGDYFFGNGSQLTGIDATSIQNGTANVRTFLNGNVTTSAGGTANVLVVTSTGANVAGDLTITGNITAGNFVGNVSGNVEAGGANTQVQFNDEDLLGGSAGFTFDKTTNAVSISGTVSAANVAASDSVIVQGNVYSQYATVTTSSVSQVVLDQWPTGTFRSAKYYAQITSGTDYQVIELSMLHDASNVYLTQYGSITTNAVLGNFDAGINGSNVEVLFTPTNATTTVRASAMLIVI